MTSVSPALQAAETALLVIVAIGIGVVLMLLANDQLHRYFARRDVAEGMPTVQYRVRFQDADDLRAQSHYFDDVASAGDFYAEKRSAQTRDSSLRNLSIDRRKVSTWEPMHIDDQLML